MKILEIDNLFAWCIIPYDSVNRTPTERAKMLLELGINSYAYDWIPGHLPLMADELRIIKRNNIGLHGVWFWLDGSGSSFFDQQNEFILKTLQDEKIQTDIWIGIPENYFGDKKDSVKIEQAVELIDYTYRSARKIGCTISLYNHGGWYGNPKNQVRIIEKLGCKDVGIIYNFHHAHDQIEMIKENLAIMGKYLRAVNINGMRGNGPKILTVSDGDKEIMMIQELINSGYIGPIGILGHVEDVDVKEILTKNLIGVEKVKNFLKFN